MMRMLCMICNEFVGEVSIEGIPAEPGRPAIAPLRYPFHGDQVGSPDPFHQVPAPFDPIIDFEAVRCPYGRTHRPFVVPDLILTHKGMVRLPKDGSPAFLDPAASNEVDRDSIGDRVMQVPDDVAEKMVREGLFKVEREVLVSDPPPTVPMSEVSDPATFSLTRTDVDVETAARAGMAAVHVCPECGKVCKNAIGLNGHMRSHKK